METSTYLVPIDFTEVTENALTFTIGLAKRKPSKIVCLHIINTIKERVEAEAKMSEVISKHVTEGISIQSKIIVGSVLKDIGVIGEAIGASLIVMGTHNPSIMGKIFGSNAMTVISNSKVPLILVQKRTEFHTIKTIVMSINLERESIQVVKAAASLGSIFQSKIILVGENQADSNFKREIEINFKLASDYLEHHGLNTEIKLLESGDYAQNLIAVAKENNADMIAATYYQDTFPLFSKNLVQHLSGNELHIPIITFDGEDTSSGSQFGFITQ